MLAAHKINN